MAAHAALAATRIPTSARLHSKAASRQRVDFADFSGLRPGSCSVSAAARDLIRGLLAKEPQKRLAYRRGAAEIKQHPFFEGVNWALVRSAAPPYIPDAMDCCPVPVRLPSDAPSQGGTPRSVAPGGKAGSPRADPASYVDFEYF